MKKIIGAVVLVVLVVGGYFIWQEMQKSESTDDAEIDGEEKERVPRLWYTENALLQSEDRQIKTIRQLREEALRRAIEAMSTPPAVSKKRKLKRLPLPKLRKGS